MSQISEINEQILEDISKTDSFYEAMWGNVDFTPNLTISEPNDYNCGAFANQLEYLYAWVEEITGQDLDDLPDPYLDIVIYFFCGLRRYPSEGNTAFILRMKSLLVREGQQTGGWRSDRIGPPWDILNVISYYLSRDQLHYIPNSILTDIIVNGGFESAIGSEWTISPSGDRSTGDQFVGSYCLDFSGFTSAAQTVAVTSGAYILNFFVDPASAPSTETNILNITLQRSSDSYYFNTTTEAWQATDPSNVYSTASDGYSLAEFFLIADGSYNVTITFTKIVDFFLDRVEFGAKEYPCYEILYVESLNANNGFASIWVSGTTPYDNASFLDQDFLYSSGANIYSDTYYQNILDIVTGSGIRGIWSREEYV